MPAAPADWEPNLLKLADSAFEHGSAVVLRELLAGLAPPEQGELLRLLAKLAEGLSSAAPEPMPVRVRSPSS